MNRIDEQSPLMRQASHVMRWRVAGVHPRALLVQAVELMAFLEISALPVMDVSGVLVGIVTVMSEAPPNPLKPTQIAYAQSLANVKGKDGEIFRNCLKWQVLAVVVSTIAAVALVYLS